VSVPVGHPAWPEAMYEPLTLAFVFPFIKHRPWQLRGSPYLLAMGRELSRLWQDNEGRKGSICGNFGALRGLFPVCQNCWHARCYTASSSLEFQIACPENDEGVKWNKTREDYRFLNARKGDMLCCPFQCDYCWHVNLTHRSATVCYAGDARLLGYIRRVNLDMMWSREPTTVQNHLRNLEKGRDVSLELGFEPINLSMRSWPADVPCSFQVAIEILRASLFSAYSQFESIRKLCLSYLTAYKASPARLDNLTLKADRGQSYSVLNSKTQSKLFGMFIHGCEKRMARLVKQDVGILFEMLMEVLDDYEKELRNPEVEKARKRLVVMCAGTFVILWADALGGGEVFMLEASEFVKRRDDGRKLGNKKGHVVIPLMGHFKNETGERNLVIVLAN